MPLHSDARASAALQASFWFALAASAVTAAYATLNARGLVYDGSFYLLAIATDQNFHLFEPARISVQILQQLPAVLGVRIGIDNLWNLGRLFSLGMYGWPVLLTAVCWFVVPPGEKSWTVGPLINLVFAIPTASFIGISEGIIASCLLWLAVLLVMFRLSRPAGALAALLATAACAVVHEGAVLCLLLIAFISVVQFARLKGFCRVVSAIVAILSVFGAFYMARWIIMPRSTIERGDFLVSVLGGFAGSPAAPNMPVIASILAALFIGAALVARRRSVFIAALGIAGVLACGLAFAVVPSALSAPSRFFAARGLPVQLTTVIAALFLFLRRREESPSQFFTLPVVSILVALVFSQALMQVIATNVWRSYVHDLYGLVTTRRGVITHDAAVEALDRDGSRFRRELLQTWSVQPLSILLAPAGQVRAVVEPAPSERWVPYDLQKPETFPQVPGLDWSHFQAGPHA